MKRVGILRGGEKDYENSLEKGGELISHIVENLSDRWKVIDIFIDKDGIWYIAGKKFQPLDLIDKVDVVWNATHPSYSNVLKIFSILFIGFDFFSFDVSKSRTLLEEHMKKIGVKMPRHFIIPPYQKDFDGPLEKYIIKKAKEVHQKFSAPWIVRSFVNNSSMGIHVAETFPKLVEALEDGVNHDASILVEELISGKNAFMHTVSNFRDENIYAFPAGNFSDIEKEKLINLAKDLHKNFGVFHYLKSNFVLHPRKGIFLTSVEFSPDFKQGSHFHKVCESVGTKTHNVIESILNSVL